ncbi:MAG TPA: acyl-CoA dehydrogenase domain-containing protein, partial [Burkholderiales bacterium]|nr:acyl-CoA dehydrogenase domain-containing protein [Burkholderiales bacterium]
WRTQLALEGILQNFPLMTWILWRLVFPLGRSFIPPSDDLGHAVASLLLAPSKVRDRLTAGIYVPADETDPVGRLDIALQAAIAAEAVEAKIRVGAKAGHIKGKTPEELAAQAAQQGIISVEEADMLAKAKQLRRAVIMVDDFPQDFGKSEWAGSSLAQQEMSSTSRRTA